MITKDQFISAANSVSRDIMTWLPTMKRQKTDIQTKVLNLATEKEMFDVRDCIVNQGMIDKLCFLAHQHLNDDVSAENYYCLALSVGTIIKEYDWGTNYLNNDALYELAIRIDRAQTL